MFSKFQNYFLPDIYSHSIIFHGIHVTIVEKIIISLLCLLVYHVNYRAKDNEFDKKNFKNL